MRRTKCGGGRQGDQQQKMSELVDDPEEKMLMSEKVIGDGVGRKGKRCCSTVPRRGR